MATRGDLESIRGWACDARESLPRARHVLIDQNQVAPCNKVHQACCTSNDIFCRGSSGRNDGIDRYSSREGAQQANPSRTHLHASSRPTPALENDGSCLDAYRSRDELFEKSGGQYANRFYLGGC